MINFPTSAIILSHATYVGPSGATAAATYTFFTKGYEPPAEPRDLDFDVVHNQNGKFKWVYDNGPGFRRFPSFQITCQDKFEAILGANAAQQYAHLLEMWKYKGTLGLQAPEEIYAVHWAAENIEKSFIRFPARRVGDNIELDIGVQFEEA